MPFDPEVLPEAMEVLREEALAKGKNPRVHPNGFIQLDLGEVPAGDSWDLETREKAERPQRGHSGSSRRLHIWNPPGIQLAHQGTVNEIHDHVFDMRSTIMRGELIQLLYHFAASKWPTHELYKAVYDKNSSSRLEATGELGILAVHQRYNIKAGSTYEQPAFTLHDTQTPYGCVVTVMEKVEIHDGDAHVAVPIDVEPDNEYDRRTAMDEKELWKAIERCLTYG